MGASSSYKKGYQVERLCAERLRNKGMLTFRSAGSRGMADVLAIDPQNKEILLVQVKKEDAPKDIEKLKQRFIGLKKLSGQYQVKSLIFIKVKGKYNFVEL